MPKTEEDWIVHTKQDVMDRVLAEMRRTEGELAKKQYTNKVGAHCAVGACLSSAALARIRDARGDVFDDSGSLDANTLEIRRLVRGNILSRPPEAIGLEFISVLQTRNDFGHYQGICRFAAEEGLRLPDNWEEDHA